MNRGNSRLGKALNELTIIVHPRTLHRGIRESAKTGKKQPARKGGHKPKKKSAN